ncbi:neural cell adhesion molecule 1-A [Pimephales promelas]|uniref:neural cell adhesion molecule 1-A n=1 Tax=Pimephales promelas TaxID=90988 RepID=UPI001955808B|nr:neural cell adhesion molecule 1-A [Pimephales promelas]
MTACSDRILLTCLILDLFSRWYALDDISIRVNHTGPMKVDEGYEFQCDIHTVAEVVVRMYKGHHQVNETIFTFNTSDRNPYKVQIHPNKNDDGAQYWCEAEQKLGEESQRPKVTSKPLSITVHYGPIINKTKLPSIVPVFRGYPVEIVCEAEGNPTPSIRWNLSTTDIVYSETLTITESTPEDLQCIANNSAGITIRCVKVVLKEDYLPLIAGLVAITVAFISVIFIFIYSIYYKKAKMGRYNLKDVKLSQQNGDIAQNGKDNSIPMKKLSQSNILA